MTATKRHDRRIERTRASLQAALLELLPHKSLAQIQIKELAARANVSRQVFYLHFDTKEDLLFSYIDDLFAEIYRAIFADTAHARNMQRETPLILSFQQWANHAEAMGWVMQVENKDRLIARLRAYVALLMGELAAHPQTDARKSPLHDHVVDFVAGGMYMVLKRWMDEGMQQSPEEMGALTYQLLTSLPSEIG